MKTSKAHDKAVNKYIRKKYDRINLTLPNGDKDIIKRIDASRGMSVNAFIKNILETEIARFQKEPKILIRLQQESATSILKMPCG